MDSDSFNNEKKNYLKNSGKWKYSDNDKIITKQGTKTEVFFISKYAIVQTVYQ